MKKTILLLGVSVFCIGACTTTPDVPATPASNSTASKAAPQSEGPSIADTGQRDEVNETGQTDAQSPIKRFEPLVYGVEKDLVCTAPVLAKGKLKKRPNLQVMWENYLFPRPEGIWSEIGGKVEVNGNLPLDQGRWTNACAVRLSHMLNKSGQKIPRDADNKTVSGKNRDQYYYRLNDFEAYLKTTYGKPDIDISDGTANSFDLPITPGIVLMDFPDNSFTGHVTIWNGAGTVDGAEIGGYRVLFWELPCFIPEGRKKPVVTQVESSSLKPASP